MSLAVIAEQVVVCFVWFASNSFANIVTKVAIGQATDNVGAVFDMLVTKLTITSLVGFLYLQFKRGSIVGEAQAWVRAISSSEKELAFVGLLHILGTVGMDASYIFISASLSQALKGSEPVFTLVLTSVVNGEHHGFASIVSSLFVCAGIALCSVDGIKSISYLGLAYSILSSIATPSRNVCIKKLTLEDKFPSTMFLLSAHSLLYLKWLLPMWLTKVYFVGVSVPVLESLASASLFAVYQLASVVFLGLTNPFTHAIVNVLKRTSTLAMSVYYFHDMNSVWARVGFLVLAIGLLLFCIAKTKAESMGSRLKIFFVGALLIAMMGAWMFMDTSASQDLGTGGQLHRVDGANVWLPHNAPRYYANLSEVEVPLRIACERKDPTSVHYPQQLPPTYTDELYDAGMAINDELKAGLLTCLKEAIPHTATHAALIGYSAMENKGESTLWLATHYMLQAMGIKVVLEAGYADDFAHRLKQVVQRDGTGVVFFAAGGNFGDPGSEAHDVLTGFVESHHEYPVVVLPNSVNFTSEANLERSKSRMEAHPSLTLIARDPSSFALLRTHFSIKHRVRFCTDMAFFAGQQRATEVARFSLNPVDIVWMRRNDVDSSSSNSKMPLGLEDEGLFACTVRGIKAHVIVEVKDWTFKVPQKAEDSSTKLQQVELRSQWAVDWLSRGRVVVADRLHAIIISHLCGRPSVALDTADHKVFNFVNAWLAKSPLVHMATDSEEALQVAIMQLVRPHA